MATVYLTQLIVNFLAAADSDAVSESLFGNLQTKVFHATACPQTNEYDERLFGEELRDTTAAGVDSDRRANLTMTQTEPARPAGYQVHHPAEGRVRERHTGGRVRVPGGQGVGRRRRGGKANC